VAKYVRYSVPHPIPYQGSKRRLANAVLSHVSANKYKRLIEPFAGSAAITLAAASQNLFETFLVSDALEPLIALWQRILQAPDTIADQYEVLWNRERRNPIAEYYLIRSEFNIDRDPAKLLYLLARCVKNAVRFNPSGEFNQSPDKRRAGTQPKTMRTELMAAHRLLHGKAQAVTCDFMSLFEQALPGDFFYLDPPYQGTSEGRDQRYFESVSRERIIEGLSLLNRKAIPFVLSYDGSCGNMNYGEPLPTGLADRVLLDVGRSSQATLNGKDHVTIESLYISPSLQYTGTHAPMPLSHFSTQTSMFT
jgi:DNA adenine methylase